MLASVRRTGRLLVATEDRPLTSFVNQIVRDVYEAIPGAKCEIVGMKEVPAPGMAPALYHATVLSIQDIVSGVERLSKERRGSSEANGSVLDNEMAWLTHAPGWNRR